MRLDLVASTGSLLFPNLARDPGGQTVAEIEKPQLWGPLCLPGPMHHQLGDEILDPVLKVRDLQVGRLWWLEGRGRDLVGSRFWVNVA